MVTSVRLLSWPLRAVKFHTTHRGTAGKLTSPQGQAWDVNADLASFQTSGREGPTLHPALVQTGAGLHIVEIQVLCWLIRFSREARDLVFL